MAGNTPVSGEVGPASGKATALSSPWPAVFAAMAANLVGVGLGRFAYAPLVPALVAEGWFSASSAAYLGAANFAGYLAGALFARRAARYASGPTIMRLMMTISAISFLACMMPGAFGWMFLWRFAAGVSGGVLMILAATTVLARIPSRWVGLASGVIFAGVGLGIAASGTLVPRLLGFGLPAAWAGLGGLCLLLTALAWRSWPSDLPVHVVQQQARPTARGLPALRLSYAFNAAGLVPHMIFLVDFVARGLGQGLESGARYWIVFGAGATVGPVLIGTLAQRIGSAAALRLALVLQCLFVAVPIVDFGAIPLLLSSFVIGCFVPGIVPVVLGRVRELIPGDEDGQKAAWGICTVAFALGQAAGAYALSYLFAATNSNYAVLFASGAIALALGLLVDLAAGFRGRQAGL